MKHYEGRNVNKYNEKNLLIKISECVKDHIQNNMNERLSSLSIAIGVSHPTSSKILNPGKESAGGIATKHWLSALSHCNLLNDFVKEIEEKAKDWHTSMDPLDKNCPEEGLQRLTWVARSFSRHEQLNVNCIGLLVGVTHNTAKSMVHYSDSSGGIAIKSWLNLLNLMKVDSGLELLFDQKLAGRDLSKKIPPAQPRIFDLTVQPSVY